jgi:hypothetical protein
MFPNGRHCLILVACLLILTASGLPRLTAQDGPSKWGARSVPVSRLTQEAGFRVVFPRGPYWKLTQARLAWVISSPPGIQLPKRKAVCLFMKRSKSAYAALIEAKSIPNVQPMDNVDVIRWEGYFLVDTKIGSRRTFGRVQGIDYVLVAHGIPDREFKSILRSLGKPRKRS